MNKYMDSADRDVNLVLREVVKIIQYIKHGEEKDTYYQDKIKATKRRLSYMYKILEKKIPFFAGLEVIRAYF